MHFGLLPLSPVNGRGTWLKGYEDLANWQSKLTIEPMPDFDYHAVNTKLLKDCIAVSGFGMLISQRAFDVISQLELANHRLTPISIESKGKKYAYQWIEMGSPIILLNLKKTPFFVWKTQQLEYFSDLDNGLQVGMPTPETGVYIKRASLGKFDFFGVPVNSKFRGFVTQRFVNHVSEHQLTGFPFEEAPWLIVE